MLAIRIPLGILAVLIVVSCSTMGPVSPQGMKREVRIKSKMIPKGKHGRKYRRYMTPRYITIHSTQNRTGDAYAHAKALQLGTIRRRRGCLCWHYTVQEDVVIQHMPTNECGYHADHYHGPGNRYSIGIEMCEHRGNSLPRTIDRTAKLAALLMYEHKIPLSRVVPHYHWPRGRRRSHKNCPHFLLDHGRPGPKWNRFKADVNRQYQRLVADQASDPKRKS